jgi:hypothetical protein
MKYFIVIHSHRHGISSYLIQCDHIPTLEEVIKACDLEDDYEPDRDDEYLEWEGAEPIIIQ